MHENEIAAIAAPKRIPWNKGKLIGPRPPLRQKHVWAIRTKLQIERQVRELALFKLAIDGKLRGCDLIAIFISSQPARADRRAGFGPLIADNLWLARIRRCRRLDELWTEPL